MLGAAAVATALDKSDKGLVLAEQLLDLSETTGDHYLMAEAYAVVAQFHATRLDAHKTFMFGQMVMCAGLQIKPDRFVPRGLHYMALAFQIAQKPRQALYFLDRAEAYAAVRGNVAQLDYMLLTRGACIYIAGDYIAAESYLRHAVEVFSGAGHYYAGALYAHGLALMKLGRNEESLTQIDAALSEWKNLKREFDQIFARHGLAELHSRLGQHREAIVQMAEAIAICESMPERCSPPFLELLRRDFATYTQRGQSVSFDVK
jgi:tetratricopeptide (TPR) repeat protein